MENTFYERKKELLTFLLAKPEEQSKLFENIIKKELIIRKIHLEQRSQDQDEQLKSYNKILDDMIYEGKLKGIEQQTKVLKEQMVAYNNGTKHSSHISIIDRKLFIVEMQLDVGVHNLLNNKVVKFFIET